MNVYTFALVVISKDNKETEDESLKRAEEK